jgi:hypothetical protein
MKLLIALGLICVCMGNVMGQVYGRRKTQIDSLTRKLIADSMYTYRFKKLRPYGNIDNRNSFYRPSNFTGFQLGVIVNEYHTFGIGFYQLNQATRAKATVNEGYSLRALRYNTVFYEYLLFNKRYFEVDLPFELGYGTYRARHTDTSSLNYGKTIMPSFVPLSAGIKFIAKPVKWLGISLMVGYRYFIETGQDLVLDFNNLYYPVGVWVDFREIYRDIKYFGFQKKRYRREVKKILPD